MLSIRFLYCKIIFPCVIGKNCIVEIFWGYVNIMLLIKLSSDNLSIYWFSNPWLLLPLYWNIFITIRKSFWGSPTVYSFTCINMGSWIFFFKISHNPLLSLFILMFESSLILLLEIYSNWSPPLFLTLSDFLEQYTAPGSFFTFPAPVLESALCPKSLGS